MSFAIVTPWFNHLELWPDYAKVAQDAKPDELLIVDNASIPSLEFAEIQLSTNRGFCGGCNEGLRAATTDIVVFLNNDVSLVRRGWIKNLLSEISPGVLAGARLRYDAHAHVDGVVMPYLDGWCFGGMREDLMRIGGFDEQLEEPGYFSDNLLCLEARVAGMSLVEAGVGLMHKSGATSQPANNPQVRAATNANQQRYLTRAREVLALR